MAGKGNVVNGTFATPGLDVALLRVAGDRCARQTPFSEFLRLSLGRAGWEGAIEPSSFSFCWCCWSLRSSCCFFSFSSQTGFSPSPVPESRVVLVTMLSLVNSHCQLLLHQKTLVFDLLSADSFSFCLADVSPLRGPPHQHPARPLPLPLALSLSVAILRFIPKDHSWSHWFTCCSSEV